MCRGPDAFGCGQLPDAQVQSLWCPAHSKRVMAGVLVGRDCQVPVQRGVSVREWRRVPFPLVEDVVEELKALCSLFLVGVSQRLLSALMRNRCRRMGQAHRNGRVCFFRAD